jgi:acyl carrier protein
MNYFDIVRDFIVENFLYGDGADLEDTTSFLSSGIVDSTGILEVVSFLEDNFSITIEDEEVVPENLDTIKDIDSFLQKKLAIKT